MFHRIVTRHLRNQNGLTLPDIVIAISIVSVVLVGMGTLLRQQAIDINRLRSKLFLSEVRDEMRRGLSVGDTCKQNFTTINDIQFQDSAGGGVTYTGEINRLETLGADGRIVFQKGEVVARVSDRLTVKDIRLANLRRGNASGQYRFDILVDLDSSIGPMAPVQILGVAAYADPALPSKPILDCTTSGLAGVGVEGEQVSCTLKIEPDLSPNGSPVLVRCAAGETLRAGGGRCLNAEHWLSASEPELTPDNTFGWRVDCYSGSNPDTSKVEAYGLCCKN